MEEEKEECTAVDSKDNKDRGRALEGVDALLESLLAARRELVGMEGSNEDAVSATLGDDGREQRLQKEYTSLRDSQWIPTLDKLHSSLASRLGGGGLSAAASEFRGGAVGTSFWEQVRGAVEHERSRLPHNMEEEKDIDWRMGGRLRGRYNDAKLYQHMLTDFVSSRSVTNGNDGGGVSNPGREAAERLKRVLCQRSGTKMELSTLLLGNETNSADDRETYAKRIKKSTSVDRRASKGRKIRYTVHPKLVNFAFPISRPDPTISEDIWFTSLFGGR